jgi:hypothetical protein
MSVLARVPSAAAARQPLLGAERKKGGRGRTSIWAEARYKTARGRLIARDGT